MNMNDKVKIAAIGAVTAIASIALYLYFSPYHSCVRALEEAYEGTNKAENRQDAHLRCARNLGHNAR